MKTLAMEDTLKRLFNLSKTKKPHRIKTPEGEFIVLPNLPKDAVQRLEFFIEDYFDSKDGELKADVEEARKQIAAGDYLSHEEIWGDG